MTTPRIDSCLQRSLYALDIMEEGVKSEEATALTEVPEHARPTAEATTTATEGTAAPQLNAEEASVKANDMGDDSKAAPGAASETVDGDGAGDPPATAVKLPKRCVAIHTGYVGTGYRGRCMPKRTVPCWLQHHKSYGGRAPQPPQTPSVLNQSATSSLQHPQNQNT